MNLSRRACFAVLAALALACPAPAKDQPRMFELRIYTAQEGRLDAIEQFFANTVSGLYKKYNIETLGFFRTLDPKQPKFLALLSHADRATRDQQITQLRADEAFRAAFTQLTKNGNPIAKAEEFFLLETDFSMPPQGKLNGEKIFELRHYTTTPNNLKLLDARFRDHTRKLFSKYGMTNLWYFHLTPDSPNADNTLIYFMAHASPAAHAESFNKFRVDPEWIAARDASEKAGGGSLTAKDGVKSTLLKATSFSPIQ